MSGFEPGERPSQWGTAGDHEQRIRKLEAVDPCDFCEIPSVFPSFQDIIMSRSPVGIWILDEDSGDTAFDSSGQDNDMTKRIGGYLSPTWQQTAGPPGTQTALSVKEPVASNAGTSMKVDLPAGLTDNYSAGCWVNIAATGSHELIGCGQSIHSSTGWMIMAGTSAGTKFSVFFDDGTNFARSDATPTTGVWYLVGFSRVAGLTTLYVNGVAQATTTAGAPTSNASAWLFNCGQTNDGVHGSNVYESWAFITEEPLTAEDWTHAYASGLAGNIPVPLDPGYVWQPDGAGGAEWATLEHNLLTDRDAAATHPADSVTFSPPAGMSSTDVQAAIEEAETNAEAAQASIDAHIADTNDAHDASAISSTDAGGYYTSDNVEGQLQEIGAGLSPGAGGTQKLFDSTLGADTASIDTGAGGIAGGFDVLEIFIIHRTDEAAAAVAVDLNVNNDTGANYDREILDGTNVTVAAAPSLAQTKWSVNSHGSGGTASYPVVTKIVIPGYAATTFNKVGTLLSARVDGTAGNNSSSALAIGWRSTAAITQFKIAAQGAAKLKTGSRLLIYGR